MFVLVRDYRRPSWFGMHDTAARTDYRGIGIYGNKNVSLDIEAVEFGTAITRFVRPGKESGVRANAVVEVCRKSGEDMAAADKPIDIIKEMKPLDITSENPFVGFVGLSSNRSTFICHHTTGAQGSAADHSCHLQRRVTIGHRCGTETTIDLRPRGRVPSPKLNLPYTPPQLLQKVSIRCFYSR